MGRWRRREEGAMQRFALSLLLLWTLACVVNALANVPSCLNDEQHQANIDKLADELRALGNDVVEGYMAFNQTCFPYDLKHWLSDDTCLGQNPSSPYGTFHLRTPLLLNKEEIVWQLREDEGVVFLGCTPPESRYFGIQGYAIVSNERMLFSSVGDSLN